MLLQQLKLENIRSYVQETVNFSEGSTLLSGDIGSGKSTILLSIEFALFGTSRPDLPAELLLRKGATQGSVELTLQLLNQNITIKRNLKKEKNSIKQTAGYIIINNVKKELMPIELKAEIISLLRYPEEFISKNKNYIFRYTVYTPQEEMKLILQENEDARLDILRKIFNLDKYKTIRDNLQEFLKKTRMNIAILKTKTEPLPEQERQLTELNKEKEELEHLIQELNPKLNLLQKNHDLQKKESELLEEQQKEYLELKGEFKTNLALLNEKKESCEQLKRKEETLKEEITKLKDPEEKNTENLKLELEELEIKKNLILNEKTVLNEKITSLQKNIEIFQKEIGIIKEQTSRIEEKEKLKEEFIQDIARKEGLEKKKIELTESLEKNAEILIKNLTFLSQSQELKQKMISLNNCPTCLQEVSEDYKQKIISAEEKKSKETEKILLDINERKKLLTEQKEELQRKIKEILEKENNLTKITLEIDQLLEKKEMIEQKEELFKSSIKENNLLMRRLEEMNKEDKLKEMNEKVSHLRELMNILTKRNILEKNHLGLTEQIEENNQQILFLKTKIEEIQTKLSNKNDLTPKIENKKQELSQTRQHEKELAIKMAQFKTKLDSINKQEGQIKEIICKLNREKNKLIKLKKTYHWLEGYFLKLTNTIEKQMMVNIHHHFNQMFQEWFSILIDDENVYSKIDDTFTPVIEQNGYEVSFNNLSGGEKTSAALAYRLALNRVVNDVVNEINTKDLLVLDEPTDGFSTEQLDKVRDVLEKLNLKQTIIVSHESKIESFVENVIRIKKEGHVSSMV